ncbi:MAG TPA: methyltransferase domain-containing protein [Pseudonocardiaceae bacterium]|nr:methyltransferase domain-containing protein [Pseudonocardiaceae bacterium]
MTAPRACADELRARMVQRLAANTYLAQWAQAWTPWQPVLAAVPRHRYLPDTVWFDNGGAGPALLPLRRSDDPDRWLGLAYCDEAVVTQVDDGRPAGPDLAGRIPTSSVSSPIIVAVMLAALDTSPGQRVCEIGTGTGYNAALLAHRLGVDQVTSIEVDPEVAKHARAALSDTGYGEVAVVTADGALGHPPGAPYDRIIATAAVHRIPYPWVEQTRPGGRILLPWANSYAGALVALSVDAHRGASGTVVAEASFMPLRDQREWRGCVRSVVGADEDRGELSATRLHPHWVCADQGARFAIGQRVPRCQWRYWPYDEQDGHAVLWLLDFESRSWAKLTHTTPDASDGEFPVRQHGPRRLWTEVDAAHRWWVDHGKPAADHWRFCVTADHQRIELIGA